MYVPQIIHIEARRTAPGTLKKPSTPILPITPESKVESSTSIAPSSPAHRANMPAAPPRALRPVVEWSSQQIDEDLDREAAWGGCRGHGGDDQAAEAESLLRDAMPS